MISDDFSEGCVVQLCYRDKGLFFLKMKNEDSNLMYMCLKREWVREKYYFLYF